MKKWRAGDDEWEWEFPGVEENKASCLVGQPASPNATSVLDKTNKTNKTVDGRQVEAGNFFFFLHPKKAEGACNNHLIFGERGTESRPSFWVSHLLF